MNEIDLKSILESENTHSLNEFILKNKYKIPNKKKEKATKTVDVVKINNSELYVSESQIHGYGVFTKSDIPKNSIIETCYTIELEFRDKYHKDKTILNYSYSLHDSSDNDREIHGSKLVFLTGNGMLYNHSDQHNAEWRWIKNKRSVDLVSIQDIKKDNEITINYGYGYWQRLNNA